MIREINVTIRGERALVRFGLIMCGRNVIDEVVEQRITTNTNHKLYYIQSLLSEINTDKDRAVPKRSQQQTRS